MKFKGLIFDIGVHTGQDTNNYLKNGYKVVGIEANPILVQELKSKFKKYIASKQLIVLNVGIAPKEGVLPFYRNLHLSEWSSFDKGIGTRNNTPYEKINIECIKGADLFKRYGIPYYMKVDIEGYDYLCLLDIPDPDKPKYVSCEASDIDWLHILKDKGYTKFKLINQADNFNPVRKVNPTILTIKNGLVSRLQKIVSFQYPYGSSGPFGEKTKGSWQTFDEVKSIYLTVQSNNMFRSSWFDFHATC